MDGICQPGPLINRQICYTWYRGPQSGDLCPLTHRRSNRNIIPRVEIVCTPANQNMTCWRPRNCAKFLGSWDRRWRVFVGPDSDMVPWKSLQPQWGGIGLSPDQWLDRWAGPFWAVCGPLWSNSNGLGPITIHWAAGKDFDSTPVTSNWANFSTELLSPCVVTGWTLRQRREGSSPPSQLSSVGVD